MNGTDIDLVSGVIKEPLIITASYMVIATIIILANTTGAPAINRCVDMPMQVRILSLNLIFTEMALGVYLFILQILKFADIHITCFFRLHLHIAIFFSRGATVAFISLDRALSIYMALTYVQFVSKRKITIVCLASWIFGIITSVQNLADVDLNEEQDTENVCAGSQKLKNMESAIIIHSCSTAIILGSYLAIFINVRRHLVRMGKLAYRSVVKISTIVLSYIIVTVPVMVYYIIVWGEPDVFDKTYALRMTLHVNVTLGSVVTPFLYVWRFRDCRKEFLKIIWRWNRNKVMSLERQSKLSRAPFLEVSTVLSSGDAHTI